MILVDWSDGTGRDPVAADFHGEFGFSRLLADLAGKFAFRRIAVQDQVGALGAHFPGFAEKRVIAALIVHGYLGSILKLGLDVVGHRAAHAEGILIGFHGDRFFLVAGLRPQRGHVLDLYGDFFVLGIVAGLGRGILVFPGLFRLRELHGRNNVARAVLEEAELAAVFKHADHAFRAFAAYSDAGVAFEFASEKRGGKEKQNEDRKIFHGFTLGCFFERKFLRPRARSPTVVNTL